MLVILQYKVIHFKTFLSENIKKIPPMDTQRVNGNLGVMKFIVVAIIPFFHINIGILFETFGFIYSYFMENKFHFIINRTFKSNLNLVTKLTYLLSLITFVR
jgi:hypothetical protein